MKALCFLLALLPCLAYGQQCQVSGDCIGFSLETQTLGSERLCLNHCKNNVTNCQWYSFDSSRGHCNLLYNCQQFDTSCTTCISGENECVIPAECFVSGTCSGMYIGRVNGLQTAEDCLEACVDDPNCRWFSYYNVTKVCDKYSTCILQPGEPNVISGERECYDEEVVVPPQESSKIFLHHYYDTALMAMPSVNASGNGTTTCTRPPNYPVYTRGAAAQVINGSITICGGTSGDARCNRFNAATNQWVTFPSLSYTGAMYTADVISPKGWWITGGFASSTYFNKTLIYNGTAWTPGPFLPKGRIDACLVQIDDTQTFMAGGQDATTTYLRDAYVYSWLTEEWLDLPQMPSGKQEHACTSYKDANGTTIILVAGDVGSPTSATSFNLATRTWKTLTALPSSAWSATFVHDGDDIVLVNPYYRNVMRFNKTTERFSIISGLTTAIQGDYTTVLQVSDEQLANCTTTY